MLFNLTSLSDEPVHRQIARQLLEKILSDAGYDGSELPRPRVLASEQHVFVNSSIVRELYLYGTEYQRFVPRPVIQVLEARRELGEKRK